MAKKATPKNPSFEEALALLRQCYAGRLAPPLEGFAYRFTIWLPIQSQGQPLFSKQQQAHHTDFFHDCFGGFSQTRVEGFPPWTGVDRGQELSHFRGQD